ncbi:MAG: hypothetical protein L6R38_001880 [Xanthoria sp. 2 TBL-2021]|nr:MAG: hypothetical protein L6R38_001880 [Xanthoria sp. 2 TBL-2021]
MSKRKSSPSLQPGEAEDLHGLVSQQQHHEASGVLRDEASTTHDLEPVGGSDNSPSNEPSFQTTTPESSTEATTYQDPAASQIPTTSVNSTATQTLTSNQATRQSALRAAALSAYNMNRESQIDVNARNPMKPRPIVPIKKKSQKDPQSKRQKREATQGSRRWQWRFTGGNAECADLVMGDEVGSRVGGEGGSLRDFITSASASVKLVEPHRDLSINNKRTPHKEKEAMFKNPNRFTSASSSPQEKSMNSKNGQTKGAKKQNSEPSSQASLLQNRSTLLSRHPQDSSLFMLRLNRAAGSAKRDDGHECLRRLETNGDNGYLFDDASQNDNEQTLATGRRARLSPIEESSVREDKDRMVAAEALIELSKEARHFKR